MKDTTMPEIEVEKVEARKEKWVKEVDLLIEVDGKGCFKKCPYRINDRHTNLCDAPNRAARRAIGCHIKRQK